MIRKLLCFILCITNAILFAQTISTDRPSQTESPFSIERRNLQIETGFLHQLTEIAGVKELQILVPTTLFRYGLTKGLELRLVGQFESLRNRQTQQTFTGFTDVEFGAKVELLNKEDGKTQIGFLSHVVLPTGARAFTNDNLGTVSKLSVFHELTKKLGLGYNIGYDYFGEGSGNFTYSLVLGLSIYDDFGVYIEPYGEVVNMKSHLSSFDAGFTYLIADNVQLDFSSGVGLNYDMDYIAFGFSINIPPKKDRD